MAVDTISKKLSLLEFDEPWMLNIPLPTDELDQADKQQILFGYTGLLWGQVPEAIEGLMCFYVTMKNKCIEVEKKGCGQLLDFKKRVTNEGTVVFSFAFYQNDTAKTPVFPKSIEWDLIDASGNVINSRYQENETPSAVTDIELFGDDLNQADGYVRYLSVRCLYDSEDHGNNLPLNAQIKFLIKPWVDTIAP